MKLLTVRHATTYRYASPVTLGEHRLMIRPKDSHDLRLFSAELILSPPGRVRWMHDVFGNSVGASKTTRLSIVSTLVLQRYVPERPGFALDRAAERYPFIYSASDRIDLGRLLEPHNEDPSGILRDWARGFLGEGGSADTMGLLAAMNEAVRRDFTYAAREEEGTQSPLQTIRRGSGSCRDYAYLFIEAARTLGLAARFVSGYLYDPKLDGAEGEGVQGAGATHAWAEVYLPGAGWVEYDPTNGLVSASSLIRVAVTREPWQAAPIVGSYTGEPGAFLGMDIEVTVTAGPSPTFRPAAAA